MKETRLFYAPDILEEAALPPEEALHAVRVLRMKEGDELFVTDGKGNLHEAVVSLAGPKRCAVEVRRSVSVPRPWRGGIHIAVAPTKHMDRMEWFAEKATEIGMDSLAFVDCANSERRVLKPERMEKIVTAATKQSHKAYKPEVIPMTAFADFVARPFDGLKFIAHCHRDTAEGSLWEELAGMDGTTTLFDGKEVLPLARLLVPGQECLVLIGPEGDFSVEEVRMAEARGFRSVSLGRSRLRTETAALVAVHLMRLALDETPERTGTAMEPRPAGTDRTATP